MLIRKKLYSILVKVTLKSSTKLQKLYLGLCVVLMAKKGWENTQNKILCDRKTFSRHLGFSTSRIWANILLVASQSDYRILNIRWQSI